MDDFVFYLMLVLRWAHILAATALIGGTLMARMAVLPAVAGLPDAQRQEVHAAIRRRWSKVVMIGILLLLVSGIVNFLRINTDLKEMKDLVALKPVYHAMFGVKFLAALVVFFLASALSGKSAAFEKLRANGRLWLTVNLMLAVLIVCISGAMRLSRDEAVGKGAERLVPATAPAPAGDTPPAGDPAANPKPASTTP